MKDGNIALACIVGIVVVAACYIGTMAAYFAVKRRKPHWRWLPEIGTAFAAFAVGVCIRLAASFAAVSGAVESGADAAGRFLTAFYQSIAAFFFDGLGADYIAGGDILSALYYGAALYAGLVAVSVVTTRVNYEIYSRVAFAATLADRLAGRCDMYVFTSVTEDSLTLARSENVIRPSRKCIIVFAGSGLIPFDHKDELCRELMRQGYFYISWYRRRKRRSPSDDAHVGSGEVPFAKRLHFFRNNVLDDASRHIFPRLHIVALGINDDTTGAEPVNGNVMFDDIAALLDITCARYSRGRIGAPVPEWIVDYHVLTDTKINYESYSRRLDEVIRAHPEIGGAAETVKNCIQMHVFNEAYATAVDLAEKRKEMFDGLGAGRGWKGSLYERDADTTSADGSMGDYRACVLGFGKTGQEAMKMLFTQTAFVSADGIPTQFVADVYDKAADDIGGLFAYEHPLFCCCDGDEGENAVTPELDHLAEESVVHRAIYVSCAQEDPASDAGKVNRETGFPVVFFHTRSCGDIRLAHLLDSHVAGGKSSRERRMRAFVICMGSDEININMANALIADVRHEIAAGDGGERLMQVIYVHIRNSKNTARLDWTAEDEKIFAAKDKNLFVCRFGDSKSIYAYDRVIDKGDAANFKFIYSTYNAYDEDGTAAEKLSARETWGIIETIHGLDPAALEQAKTLVVSAIQRSVRGIEFNDRGKWRKWMEVSPYEKESNLSVKLYSSVYERMSEDIGDDFSVEDLLSVNHMAMLEKTRWNRFYMSHGWVFGKKNKPEKVHDGILSCAAIYHRAERGWHGEAKYAGYHRRLQKDRRRARARASASRHPLTLPPCPDLHLASHPSVKHRIPRLSRRGVSFLFSACDSGGNIFRRLQFHGSGFRYAQSTGEGGMMRSQLIVQM